MCDIKILSIANRIVETKADDPHFQAVQAQVAFALRIFDGILRESAKGNGLAGEVLVRTLFEAVTGTIILAKHPEMLDRFVRHARFTELRILHSVTQPELKPKVESHIKGTEEELNKLFKEFGENRWHGIGTKDSFTEAELPPRIYEKYYRRASAIAHAQPYTTVRNGKVAVRPIAWQNLARTAPDQARLLMGLLLKILDREFKLKLDSEIAAMDKEILAIIEASKAAILKAVASEVAKK